MFNAPKLKSLVFKYSWMKYLFWLSCISIILPLILFIFGAIEAVFMMFLGALFLCTSGVLLGLGNIGAIKQAYQAGDWAQQDYEHYTFRAKLGLLFFGIPAACGILFLLFMVVEQKVNLTITAVPTPELMAEMKQYLFAPNIKHSSVNFNDEEQKITFYKNNKFPFLAEKYIKYNLPQLPTYHTKNLQLSLDNTWLQRGFFIMIEGKRSCVLARKLDGETKYDKPTRVNSSINNLDFYVYQNYLYFDVSKYSRISKKKKWCTLESNMIRNEKDSKLIDKLDYEFMYPHLSHSVITSSNSNRLSLLNWSELNNNFRKLLQ